MSPQEIVEAFIDAWNRGDVPAAFGMMAEDIVWHNIPMEPAVGLAGVQARKRTTPRPTRQRRTQFEIRV